MSAQAVIRQYYSYPAVFHRNSEENGNGPYHVSFPDIPIAVDGNSFKEARENAHQILKETLGKMRKEGKIFPEASPVESVDLDSPDVVVLISAWG